MRDLATVSLFFSLLGLLALVGVAAAVPILLAARFVPAAARARDELVAVVGPVALPLALVVAVVAMVGSLWFSEVVGLTPCTLCWYQRIAIYPQVLVLGVAVVRRDDRALVVAAALATVGLTISTYHYAMEWFPTLDAGACSSAVPCSFVWFRRFGFVSLPGLAWLTSASIAWLAVVSGRWARTIDVSPGDAISHDVVASDHRVSPTGGTP